MFMLSFTINNNEYYALTCLSVTYSLMYLHLTRYDKDVVDKKMWGIISHTKKGTFMKIIIVNIQLRKAFSFIS